MAKCKPSIQQVRKKYSKQCFFCGESDYSLLDCHRIFEGSKGGKYDWINTTACCVKCHRKIHTDKIKILGHHMAMKGGWVLHFIDEHGQEQWKQH